MFTGLVEELGEVASVERNGAGGRLSVRARCATELREGDSVSVNGVCLTALAPRDGRFTADLSPETIARSTLGQLGVGDVVNLELAIRAGERFGGHIVQGHVDGIATLSEAADTDNGRELTLTAPPELLHYVVEMGSIAVNGVSLTVTSVDSAGFSVSLIPETIARTNLTEAKIGDRANLEVDMIAKYVEKLVPGRE